jgi:heme oxygenase
MTHHGSRFALRDLTRSDHERLDALVGDFSDTEAYGRYLEGMAAFRGAIERALEDIDYPESFGVWRPSFIFRQLEQDLEDLGRGVPDASPAFDLPKDENGLLGVLYVLEGSALGARLLVRRAAALGFSADQGARHLAAQTSRPESWGKFVALLDGMVPAGLERAAQAARATFQAAIDAFGGIGNRERAG